MRTFDEYIKVSIPLPELQSSVKTYIIDDVLFIDGVLDTQWCKKVIDVTDKFYTTMKDEYSKNSRDSDRFLTINKDLAELLWFAIKDHLFHYLKSSENVNRPKTPFGFGVKGLWNPIKINECFRFNKYLAPSSGFEPHRDSLYVESFNKRSIYTILIYLNDINEDLGGKTVFIEPNINKTDECPTVKEEIKDGHKITSSIKPKSGLIAIMCHNRIHSAEPLHSGLKYVIRSDIIFECYERPSNYSSELWKNNEKFLSSVGMYLDAKRFEMAGNVEKASQYYEKGLAIRQHTYI